jgi:hypothetical protein
LQCVDTRDKSEEIHDVWPRLAGSSYDVCSAARLSLMERDDADFHYLNDKCSESLRNFLNENVFCLSQNEAEDEHCTVNIFGSYCKKDAYETSGRKTQWRKTNLKFGRR